MKGQVDKVRIKRKNKNDVIFEIQNNKFYDPDFLNYINNYTFNVKDIEEILNSKNHFSISEFLFNYENYSEKMLFFLKDYTLNYNPKNSKEKLFYSDLIEFSIYNNISLNIKKLFKEGRKFKKDDELIISILNYLFEKIDFYFFKETILFYEHIKNNEKYSNHVRMISALYLLRLTSFEKHFIDLQMIYLKGILYEKEIIKNVLKLDYFKNFSYFDKISNLLD